MTGKLILEDGSVYTGEQFGAQQATSGEVVFATGMVGYPESLTDPSYAGQILVCTYPLIGNYGVPPKRFWESDKMHVRGLIVSTYNDTPSHATSTQTLDQWLRMQNVSALVVKDTRALTLATRDKGAMLGKITFANTSIAFSDPNKENLAATVSCTKPQIYGAGKKTVFVIDCGAKKSIITNLVARGVRVVRVPWNFDVLSHDIPCDAVVLSNGPGNPKKLPETVANVKKILAKNIPTFGICLGNQMLGLAAGGDTYKLPFGHRSQNQPCRMVGSPRCYLTTQNHGFALSHVPRGFDPWFVNANDGTNEGIMHRTKPFMSVQFHPESTPGPLDTEWLFDYFLERAFGKNFTR